MVTHLGDEKLMYVPHGLIHQCLTVNSIWGGGSTPLLQESFLARNGLTDSYDFLQVFSKFFQATFNANFMTLATSGAGHVTYSQQWVKRKCVFLEVFGP